MYDEMVHDQEPGATADADAPDTTSGRAVADAERAESADAAASGSGHVGLEEAASGLERASEGVPAPEWQAYPAADDGVHHTVVGTMKVMHGVASPELGNERPLYVYLPPSYATDPERRFPVLYMHDGQNLFDVATSFGGEWEVDQTLESASADGLEAIVVGIPNAGAERLDEYSPFVDERHQAGGRGDAYLDFVVGTVKPLIDRDFRTLPERDSTGVAGSSMGGLITLYAFFRHPEVFGFAGIMSPALWFGQREIYDFVRDAAYVPGRIYVDVGTREGREELTDVRRLRDLLIEKGYRKGKDFLYVVEMGGTHSEAAWARRLRKELQFLLGTPLATTALQ
ncbi:MAG TPA: alpha/beta hydrolase-fold protein [Longimicrobiaceae bacterium]|nr:alpha/beta hydrolase-fold protein [Longimicrobiaceae bacterium]